MISGARRGPLLSLRHGGHRAVPDAVVTFEVDGDVDPAELARAAAEAAGLGIGTYDCIVSLLEHGSGHRSNTVPRPDGLRGPVVTTRGD